MTTIRAGDGKVNRNEDLLGASASSASSPAAPSGDTPSGVVFIDSCVPDAQDLIDGAKPGERVFVLDPGGDGVQQIADILATNGLHDLAAISIVAHGSSGALQLGATELDDGALSGESAALKAIGASLTPGGDLQLYACDVASGAGGRQFIADLSHVTGADVAAATHLVGAADLGGSFTLDAATGPVQAAAPFTAAALAGFQGKLASVTPFDNDQPSLPLSLSIITGGLFPTSGGGDVDLGGVPLGSILTFAGNFAIYGTVLAQGQLVSPLSQNVALFATVGVTYGGNGVNSYGLPDLQGRTMIGSGQGPGLDQQALGAATGSDTVTLSQSQMPAGFGGSGQPFDNDQPSLPITYLVNTAGAADGSEGDDLLGAVIPFAGNFSGNDVPGGYLEANGQLLSTTTYSALFNLIGYTYGGSGGSFALPDLRGRTVVGASIDHPLGQSFGQDETSIASANLPASDGGQGTAIGNFGPSIALNYIVATTGIYPSIDDGDPSTGSTLAGSQYIGEVLAYAGSTAPTGWAFADGSLLPVIAGNAALFSILGVKYGGNGQTTFALPDLRGRDVVGAGNGATLGVSYGSDDITLTSSNIFNVVPTLSVGTNAASTEQTPSVISSGATVTDANLDALNSGNGDYGGASLTITRDGGANADDFLGISTSGASFTASGGNLQSAGQTFANFTSSGGTLTIDFTGAQTIAMTALVDDVLQHITYTNESDAPPASVLLDWTFSDGNAGAQGAMPTPGEAFASTTETVTAVDDAPVVAIPTTQTTDEDTPLVFSAANGNAIVVSDADDTSLTVSLATNGLSLTLATENGLTFSGGADGDWSMTFSGTIADINAALDGLVYVPYTDTPGPDVVEITADDGLKQTTVDANINVNAVNDAPVLTAKSPTLTSVAADNFSSGGQKVSAILGSSDNDPDGFGVPRGIAITGETEAGGTWQYSLDNGSTWANVPGGVAESAALVLRDSDYVRFLPDGSHVTGTETLTYRAWDQTDGSTAGTQVDITATGGATAFSDATDTASLSVIDNTPPALQSIVASDPTLTNAGTVHYTVTFSEPVTGVDASQFSVAATSGITGAKIASVSGSGTTYSVTVNTGSGDGALELQVNGSAIHDLAGNPYSGGTFLAPKNYQAGFNPWGLAIGDFNGDGKSDVVTADEGDATLAVLLGNGDGSLQTRTFAGAVGPLAVTIGDVNGDGNADLVAANWFANSISVLLGNGNGMFQAKQDTAVGTTPESLATGDFNGDGKLDVVTANNGSNNVSVLLGNKDGTFTAASPVTVGSNPVSVAVADLNGDGNLDIVAATAGGQSEVLLGKGDGTFTAQAGPMVGAYSNAIALGDVNGDGKLDIIAADDVFGKVDVLLGNGGGSFQTRVEYAAGSNPYSLALGDVNGDGKLDVVVADNNNSGTVSILLGNGDGSLQAPLTAAVGSDPTSVALADLNDDGQPDIVAANEGSSTVSVLLNAGVSYMVDKTADAPTIESVTDDVAPVTGALASGDSTNDPDLAVKIDLAADAAAGDTLQLYGSTDTSDPLGSAYTLTADDIIAGSVTLQTGALSDGTTYDLTARATDSLDNQSDASAAVTVTEDDTPPTVQIAQDDPAATNLSTVTYTVTFSEAVAGVDTGQFSLATTGVAGASITNVTPGAGNSYTVTVDTGSGDGTIALDLPAAALAAVQDGAGNAYPGGAFAAKVDYTVGKTPFAIASGDFNGDGVADLVTANYNANNVSVLLGAGDGTFGAATPFATDTNPAAVAAADIDGDGNLDIVTANFTSESVSVLLGDGTGDFPTPKNFDDTQFGISDLAIGDFNEDGHPDIADIHAASDGKVAILLNTGTASLFPTSPDNSYALADADAKPFAIATADFNGDGHLDLAVVDNNQSKVDLLLGDGNGAFGAASAIGVGSTPDAIAVGDFNADGNPDIVTGNSGTGNISVLIGNGSGGFTRHDTNVSAGPLTVAVGDFNGDGKLDIAADVSSTVNTVSVLFGNGDGTFQAPTDYSAGSFPVAVAVADFDGDGRPDLAAANESSKNVSVLLNEPADAQGAAYTIDRTPPDTSITADPGVVTASGDASFTFGGTDTGGSGVASYKTWIDSAAAVNTTGITVDYTGLAHGDHTFAVAAVDAAGNVDPTPATFSWAVDQAPVAVNDSYSVDAESTLTVDVASGVLANDSDADGDLRTAVNASDPSHGTVTLNTNGSFTYTPTTGFHGADSFTYQANDGFTNSNTATVNIMVNDIAPVANGDSYTTDEDTLLTIPAKGVLANDTDADPNDILTAAVVADPANGSLTLNANGSFTYTPGLNFNGADSFTYKANDGTDDSTVATVSLTINAVNDPPTVTVASPTVAWPHAAVAVAPDITVGDVDNTTLASATVTDNDFLAGEDVLSINGATSGTFVGTDGGSIAYSYAAGTLTLTGTDTLADYQQALAAVAYDDVAATPNLGTVDISFVVNDGTDSSVAADKTVVLTDQAPTIGVGALDLAVTNIDSNNVGVFLGDGSGGFAATAGSPVAVGSGPEGIAVGDLNGDGNADLAVANWGADTVSLLYGDGRGGFGGGLTLTPFDGIGDGPASVALGDLDGDGKADLVVADDGYNSGGPSGVTVLLNSDIGSGSGSFIDLSPSDLAPEAVALGDMDGDGNLDIVTADTDENAVSVILGNGDGTFETDPEAIGLGTFDVGASPWWVAVGDINGDGFSDIVTANNDSNNVSVLLNEGDGDFTRTDVSTVDGNHNGTGPYSVSLGDLDGQNGLDIVTANDDGTVSVLLNDGQGGFDLATYAVGAEPTATLGDVDGDGDLDIVTANYNDDTSSVLLNDGNGAFAPAGGSPFLTGGTGPYVPALGHFDTAQTINEDTPLVFSGADKITIADADGDNQTVTLGAAHGTLTLGAATAGLGSFSGNGSNAVTLSGTLTAVNAALDGLTYKPTLNFNGADTLAIASDDGIEQAQSSVAITINPVNDAPVIMVSDPAPVTEGDAGVSSPVTVTVANQVTISDPDAGDIATKYVAGTLAFSSSTAAPGGGNLSSLFTLDPANGTISYDAAAFDYLAGGATATATFSFNSSSGPDTLPEKITLTIDGENDAPVLAGGGNTVNYTERGTAVAIDPGLTVADIDSATLVGATVTIADPLAGDALALNGTASGIFNGKIAYSFSGGVLTLIGAATTADYQTALEAVTFGSTSHNPTNFGANPTRTVQWQVDDGQADNHASNQTTSVVIITAIDDPAAAKADAFATLENGTVAGDVFADNGSGADSDVDSALAVTAVNGSAANVDSPITLASGALLTLNADGNFSYNPNHAFDYLAAPGSGASDTSTTDGFTYTLNGQSTAAVTVSITGVDSDDLVLGTAGNDRLNGGIGADTLTGEGGTDTFVFAPDDGADTITDFTAGGATGHDTVDLTGFSNIRSFDAVLAHATESNGNSVLDFGNGDALTLQNVLESSLTPDDFLLPLNPPHDFNADAMSDLLWQNDNGHVSIWEMNGTNVVNNPTLADNPGPSLHAIGTGDFNADGFADILWQDTNGAVSIWEMDGTNVIDKTTLSVNPGPAWHVIGTGDFNGDGFADILWQNTNGAVSIWEMDGTNVVSNPMLGAHPGPSWHAIGAGDFNGDGKSDILWQNTNGAVSIWEMNGTNIVNNPTLKTNPGPSWHVIDAGDFNGDGFSDILWQNTNGAVSIWEMDGTNVVYNPTLHSNPGPSTHAVNAADYNGDGKADIAWQSDNGAVSIWEMDGANVLSQSTLEVNPGTHWHVIGPHNGLTT